MDLATAYLGLSLRNPLVASPSPLSNTADGVRRLAEGVQGRALGPRWFEPDQGQQQEAAHSDQSEWAD